MTRKPNRQFLNPSAGNYMPHISKIELPRPVCQYCGISLGRRYETWWRGEKETIRKDALAWTSAWEDEEGLYRLDYWAGRHEGFGSDREGQPIFCSPHCAAEFAIAAYNGSSWRWTTDDGLVLRRHGWVRPE